MKLNAWHTRISAVTLHHAAIKFYGDDNEAAKLIQSIRRVHQRKNWGTEKYPAYAPDITYHVAINPNTGRIFYLNSINAVTWHDSNNNFSLGALVLGDGRTQNWNSKISRALDSYFEKINPILLIDKRSLRGHRDVKATVCPGDNYYTGMLEYIKTPYF